MLDDLGIEVLAVIVQNKRYPLLANVQGLAAVRALQPGVRLQLLRVGGEEGLRPDRRRAHASVGTLVGGGAWLKAGRESRAPGRPLAEVRAEIRAYAEGIYTLRPPPGYTKEAH